MTRTNGTSMRTAEMGRGIRTRPCSLPRALLAAAAALALATPLQGCLRRADPPARGTPATGGQRRDTIVTSFYPMYVIALNVVRDTPGVSLLNLAAPAAGCLHDYQLTPDDVKTLSGARVLIVNGAGMESYLDRITRQLPDLTIVDATRGLPLLTDENGEPNPHVWVSVSGAISQVKNVAEQLAEAMPEHAAAFRANAAEYAERLQALREEMHLELDRLPRRDIVTFHEAFPYFAREFNLNVIATIEREPGSEPSAAELAETIRIVKESRVRALFVEPQYPDRAARTIAAETGARVYTLDPAVTGPMEAGAYLDIMRGNMKTLREALADAD